jgi:hypothetical protein
MSFGRFRDLAALGYQQSLHTQLYHDELLQALKLEGSQVDGDGEV